MLIISKKQVLTSMTDLVVRNLEEDVEMRLKRRAARHGRSMEDEAREILRDAVNTENRHVEGLGTKLARRFAGRGLDFDIPEIRVSRLSGLRNDHFPAALNA
jgi:plasmid stability protein